MPELTTLEAIDCIEDDRGRDAARKLNAAASILAVGVLTDSTAEHYRAGFHNRVMFVAPVVAGAALAATATVAIRQTHATAPRTAVFGASVLTGLVGFGF